MKFITAESGLPLPPCAATIGCFDGVHRGHRYLIDQVRREALARGLHSALITFPVHPRQVMQSGYCPQWLTCLPQKKELLQQEDADYCILLPFTHELSLLSARRFMELLHTRFNVQALVIGYDHRFGHNRSEGFADYCRYGKELGIEVVHARALVEDGVSISSSLIRTLLKQGDAVRANRCLGYRYYLDGKVVSGYQVGRKLGFPTANLQPSCPDKLVPQALRRNAEHRSSPYGRQRHRAQHRGAHHRFRGQLVPAFPPCRVRAIPPSGTEVRGHRGADCPVATRQSNDYPAVGVESLKCRLAQISADYSLFTTEDAEYHRVFKKILSVLFCDPCGEFYHIS